MKVYIVTYCYFFDKTMSGRVGPLHPGARRLESRVGVYSTIEKARNAADHFIDEDSYCNIEEVEVQ